MNVLVKNEPKRTLAPDLLKRFAAIVGDKYAITDPQMQQPYLLEMRDLFRGQTPVILRPGSGAEGAAIVKLANETKTAIVPQGGNTGLVGGQIPHHNEIVLSLNRLDKVREVAPISNTMTVEVGVTLQRAREAVAAARRLYPQLLPSEGTCTIGGNLSTNAGGVAAVAHGISRSHAMGLEVVLADGRVLNVLNKLKKDNTGYDLRDLFIGAEGTLGVITAVETMRRAGVEAVIKHDSSSRDPLATPSPWYVLIELSSQARSGLRETMEGILSEGMERGLVTDATIADSLDQAKAFWRIREMFGEVQRHMGGSIKHDISVPIAAIPAFIEEANAAATKLIPGARPMPFGHVGDGNIRYNITQPEGMDKAAFLARWGDVNKVVFAVVKKYNGSISAEHGVGVMKRDILHEYKDPVALDLMRGIKQKLDPNVNLNPGKVL